MVVHQVSLGLREITCGYSYEFVNGCSWVAIILHRHITPLSGIRGVQSDNTSLAAGSTCEAHLPGRYEVGLIVILRAYACLGIEGAGIQCTVDLPNCIQGIFF